MTKPKPKSELKAYRGKQSWVTVVMSSPKCTTRQAKLYNAASNPMYNASSEIVQRGVKPNVQYVG